MQENKIGKSIQSVQRAIDILECFDESRVELSLNEISQMLGINKSTVHGIINTLYNNGYIRQNEERKYLLGQAILGKYRYAASTRRSLLISLAKPYMQEASDKHKTTINLFVVADNRAIFAYQVIPHMAKYTLRHVSDNSPLYSTATGKLTLSKMPSEALDRYIHDIRLEEFSVYTITNKDVLRKNLEEIKITGYSYENEELVEGVSAISVPILHKSGEWVAAVSVVDIAFHITKNKVSIVSDLKKAAEQISQKLI